MPLSPPRRLRSAVPLVRARLRSDSFAPGAPAWFDGAHGGRSARAHLGRGITEPALGDRDRLRALSAVGSDVKQVDVLDRDTEGHGTRVEYRVAGLGKSIRYVLEYDYTDTPGTFSWHFVEGDWLRKLDGRYGFEPVADDTRDVRPGRRHVRTASRADQASCREHDHGHRAQGAEERGGAMSTEALRDDEPDARDENDYADPEAPGPTMPPPTAVESLVNALLEAGPEVAEHVVKAAQELLLAVQVVVDAADRAVQEQQMIRAERAATDESGAGDGGAGDPDEAEVRHLDLAD